MRKPDPEIFRHALALLGGPPPESAVFLDDCEGNLRGAERIGMRGVLVGRDPRRALVELDALLAAQSPQGDPGGTVDSESQTG